MINVYLRRGDSIECLTLLPGMHLPLPALWIDLHNPTDAEKETLERALELSLPTREAMQEIESSSRFYTEGHIFRMTATVLANADGPNPSAESLAFILCPGGLITLRYSDPRPISSFAIRLTRQPSAHLNARDILIGLLEAFVDRLADILERIGVDLDTLSQQIFDTRPSTARRRVGERRDLQAILKNLGRNEDLTSNIRESLLSLTRLIRFITPEFETNTRNGLKELRTRLKSLRSDIISLNEHSTFESHKVNFLLDATLGMISIEQNRIIKIFSVAAVVFLPPTLVASIYGMNFHYMPELSWLFGYPTALGLMVLSAIVPFLYFRRMGWL
ncbi:MAG: magnesium transporter CorA family protein [Alphaproteobacteria bacterium]